MTLNYVELSGTFDDGSDQPLSGTAVFTPNVSVYASGVPQVTPDTPVTAQIVAGSLRSESGGTLQLLATDNSGLTFLGQTGFFFWTVAITIAGQVEPAWSFFLPHGSLGNGPVDLYSLANTPASGGSGLTNPMTTLGDMISGGSSGTPARLAGNITAIREFLASMGSGSAAAAPAWTALEAGDIPALPYDASGAAAAAQAAAEAYADTNKLAKSANLSDVANAGTARTNLGLGTAAVVALATLLQTANNLSDLASTSTARTNLGLGSAATQNSGAFDASGSAATAQANAEAASLPLAGGTMTGWLAPAVVTLSQSGGNVAVNAALGNDLRLTLTASGWTIGNPSNPVDGQDITFILAQDSTGSRTVSWGSAYDFGTTGAPTLTTTASKRDMIAFKYCAAITSWLCLGSSLGF